MGDTIDKLVRGTADKIKAVLLEAVEELEFPEILVGISDSKSIDNPKLAKELLKEKMGNSGVALPKKGIIVYVSDNHWPHYVIMLQDGLYRFDSSLFRETKEGKFTGSTLNFPYWETRREVPFDYINHGTKALHEIKNIKEATLAGRLG